MDNYIDYINVDYTVCGKVKTMAEYEIDIYDNLFLSIVITEGFFAQRANRRLFYNFCYENRTSLGVR